MTARKILLLALMVILGVILDEGIRQQTEGDSLLDEPRIQQLVNYCEREE